MVKLTFQCLDCSSTSTVSYDDIDLKEPAKPYCTKHNKEMACSHIEIKTGKTIRRRNVTHETIQ